MNDHEMYELLGWLREGEQDDQPLVKAARHEVTGRAIAEYFDSRSDGWTDWLFRGALQFGEYSGPAEDRLAAGTSLARYFDASPYRVANGYIKTDSPSEIWHIILRRNS